MPISGMPLTVSMSSRPRLISYRSGTSRNCTPSLAAVVDDAHDRLVRRARQGDDDLVDALLVDDPFELVRRAQTTEATEVGLAVG